jgi:hypothetical protein
MEFDSKAYTDRHGVPLAAGQRIRVQRCIGRYGQTEITEGEIVSLSPWGGATLRTLQGEKYVTLIRSGYEKFDDFEHGHEKWTEIVGA